MPKNPTQWDAVRLSIFCCRRNIPSFISTTHLAEALGQCGRGAWEKMQRHSELSLLKRPPQYPQPNILWRSVFSKEFLLASYIYCQYLWMGLLFCIWKAQAGSRATARSVLPVVLWRWKVCTSRWEIRPALMSLGKNVVPWRAKRGGLGVASLSSTRNYSYRLSWSERRFQCSTCRTHGPTHTIWAILRISHPSSTWPRPCFISSICHLSIRWSRLCWLHFHTFSSWLSVNFTKKYWGNKAFGHTTT